MIHYELNRDDGVLVVSPEVPLAAEDFERVGAELDPYLEEHGRLHGLMIRAEKFPGWENFGGLVSHLRFVRDHHRRIERVAAVSDDKLLSVLPRLASHFINAEVKHFPMADEPQAIDWLRGKS